MKTYKEIVEAKGPHDADWVEKSSRHERLYAYHKRMGNEAEAAKHKAEVDKLYKREEVELDESHVEFRLDHREKTTGDTGSTFKDHEAKVSDQTDKATYIKVPKHKADSFKSAMKSKHGARVELDEELEQIDELSKDTLKSYLNKATKDVVEKKRQEQIAINRSKQDRLQGKYGQRSALRTAEFHKSGAVSRATNIGKAAMKLASEEVELDEKLDPSMGAGEYVTDFQKSDAPQFAGKSKEKRRQMAIAAYLDAKRQVKEGVIQSSGTDQIPVAGNTVPAEVTAKKKKEKPMTYHDDGTPIKEQAPVAPVPPKSGYVVKYHTKDGEHKNTSKLFQSKTLADIHANKGNGMDKVGGKYTVHKIALKEETIEENAPVAPVPDKKYIKGTPEYKAYMASKKPRVGHPTNVKEEVEDIAEGRNEGDTPFDKPYKTVTNKDNNVKDKSGAVHTPMSRAKDLAKKAMKAQMKEQFGIDITDEQADSLVETANLDEGKMKDIATNRSEDNRLHVPKKNTDIADKSYLKTAGKKTGPLHNVAKGLKAFVTGKAEPMESVDIDVETGDLVESKVSYSEFVAQLNEYESKDGRYVHTKGSYGKAYQDPEGADDADDKKPSAKGRKVGSKSGPRKILGTSKLHK